MYPLGIRGPGKETKERRWGFMQSSDEAHSSGGERKLGMGR